MKQIVGKVSAVSKYGGVKVGDTWYNPANKEGSDRIKADKEALLNKEVELFLNDAGKIVGYNKPKETAEVEVESVPPNDNPVKLAILDRDRKIIKQNALSHATQIVLKLYEFADDRSDITADTLTEAVISVADKLVKWVLR